MYMQLYMTTRLIWNWLKYAPTCTPAYTSPPCTFLTTQSWWCTDSCCENRFGVSLRGRDHDSLRGGGERGREGGGRGRERGREGGRGKEE